MKITALALTVSIACLLSFASISPVVAQTNGPDPNVSMIVFPIVKQGSQQFVVTPKGFHIAIPGKGIASNAKEVIVYQDAEKNYWYVNKHGEPTPIPPQQVQDALMQVQQQMNAANAAQMGGQYQGGQPPQQYAGQPPVQQTTIVEQPNNNGGNGTGAAVAGMAGMAGGMVAGAAMSGAWNQPSYYGVPYGHPLYHGEGGNNYYVNNNGEKAYVNNQQYNKNVNAAATQYNNNKQAANTFNNKSANSAFDQWNKQGQWKDKDQWSKGLQSASGRFGGAEEGRRFGGGEEGHRFGGDGGRFGGGRRGGGRRR